MSQTHPEHEKIARLLEKARLARPPAQVHEQVVAAARQAWDQELVGLPWQLPLRRFALAAAAAILVVSMANHFSEITEPQKDRNSPAVIRLVHCELPEQTRMVYQPARSRLAAGYRRNTVLDRAALQDRLEIVRRILDEVKDNGIPVPPTPGGGRSRLPGRSGLSSYS